MDADGLTARLEAQGAELVALFRAVPQEEIRRRPAEGRWSSLEVLGHLHDEETGDFRVRIERTLAGADEWPPIDPDGWVVERDHQSKEPFELLESFERERAISVSWLRSLKDPDWSRSFEHGTLGPLSAGDLLASWVAHDLMHMAQVQRIRVEALRAACGPYSIGYAAP